jgi:hypothetical protein
LPIKKPPELMRQAEAARGASHPAEERYAFVPGRGLRSRRRLRPKAPSAGAIF